MVERLFSNCNCEYTLQHDLGNGTTQRMTFKRVCKIIPTAVTKVTHGKYEIMYINMRVFLTGIEFKKYDGDVEGVTGVTEFTQDDIQVCISCF